MPITNESLLQSNVPSPFDPSAWLSDQCQSKGIDTKVTQTVFQKKKEFDDICSIVRDELRDLINVSENEEGNEWLDRQHNAIIGNRDAMSYFINKIEEVLRVKNITSIDIPDFYNSLSEAIFHEVWGKSILTKWDNRYPDSEACIIAGQELWIDIDGQMVRQQEKFESTEKVKKIIEAFKMRDPNAVLNYQNPELETEHEDGSRITMVISPRGKETYIVFRRFIIKNFSLEEQARHRTIPFEDIGIYRNLAKTMCNTIYAGRVRSAKSTFMKSMIAERNSEFTIALLEKHFELALKKHMPDRLIYEFQSSDGELHRAVPRLLRMEHDFIIVGEIRSKELEGAMMACERGERGFMSTYHLTDVENVVPQLTRHLLDEFPNRSFEMEQERVAKNIDIIITMSTDRDRKTKRVTSLSEINWNYQKRDYEVRRLIHYVKKEAKYYYSSDISPRLFHLMSEEDEDAANEMMKLLKKREQTNSLSKLFEEGILL